MNKAMRVVGFVLAGALVLGCDSKSNNGSPGVAGTTGAGGTTGTGGTTGAAGTNADAAVVDASFPVDGRCAVQGATSRDGGACMCNASTPTICGAACVDTQTDNDHCGDCATKCGATSACVAGKCGAAPTTLVPAAAGCESIELLLSGTTLYWTDKGHGTVKSIGTGAAATAATIATAQMAPALMALSGTTLYWIASGSKSIMKATLPTGTPAMVHASATDPINGLTLSSDGGTVYFSAGQHILKTPSAGGSPATNIHDQDDGIPGNLALAGTSLAFGSDEAQDIDVVTLADGKVSACGMRDDAGSGFCTMGLRLARSQGSILLDTIYLTGGKVYWAHGDALAMVSITPTGTGGAMPIDKIVSSASFDAITAFAIQGSTAYFAENGAIERSPLTAGSEPTVIARGQPSPTALVADADKIYWASDCAIMTMPAK